MQHSVINAGRTAAATLLSLGDRTEVSLSISKVPDFVALPIHLDT